jgi:hypothetical protein
MPNASPEAPRSYGLIAAFKDSAALVGAIRSLRRRGYCQLEAYTPFPVDGVAEALDFQDRSLTSIALGGGLIGAVLGTGVAWWCNAWDFTLNVGGRPLAAWPAFAIPGFETAMLGAALAALGGMLVRNGLPRLHHPVFNARLYRRSEDDAFLLLVESADPLFDRTTTSETLWALGAEAAEDVPW